MPFNYTEEFSLESVTNGVPAPDHAASKKIKNAVWLEIDGEEASLRYWSSGLTADTTYAVFYIHGDRLWAGNTCSYADNNSQAQQKHANDTAHSINMPYIKIARPGLYGSSGAHSARRQMREIKLVEYAVREIIQRHGIKHYGFTGQSGGGSIAAYLLTRFPEVECVTLTSSALSLENLKKSGQINGYDYGESGIYDPIQHIVEIPQHPHRRIFVIGDIHDEYALFSNQIEYYEAVKALGHTITLIHAEGDRHHSLDVTGQHTTAWCLQGLATETIMNKIANKEVIY